MKEETSTKRSRSRGCETRWTHREKTFHYLHIHVDHRGLQVLGDVVHIVQLVENAERRQSFLDGFYKRFCIVLASNGTRVKLFSAAESMLLYRMHITYPYFARFIFFVHVP